MLRLIDRPVLQGWVRRCLEGPISRPGGWNQGVEDMRYERLGEGCTRESSEVLSIPMYSLTHYRQPVQGFCKEFVTWKAPRHPNVLPLIGVMMAEDRFAMVSEWMTNGNINQFVTAHRDVNRFELVSPPFKFL